MEETTTKSDMYSFGILCWVILHQRLPKKGVRPDINHGGVVNFIPPIVKNMIVKCWEPVPDDRCTAIECLAKLQKAGNRSHYDIYFCYSPTKNTSNTNNETTSSNSNDYDPVSYTNNTAYTKRFYSVADTILYHLIRLGYRVYFDDDADVHTMNDARRKRIQSILNKSNMVIFFADSSFQSNPSCMYTLACVTKGHLQSNNNINYPNKPTNHSIANDMDTTTNTDDIDNVTVLHK